METIKVTLTGCSPMLQHRDTLSNPLHPLAKAHKEVSSKRKKTDEDYEFLAHSEWKSSIYHDEKIGPYVPAMMIEATLMQAAKLQKLGTKFKSAIMVVEDKAPLQYDGPRDLASMFKDPAFVDMRSVKVQQARIQRCRPKFDNWKINFTVGYNSEVINEREIVKALEDAGTQVGLGDFRPRFGKFAVSIRK